MTLYDFEGRHIGQILRGMLRWLCKVGETHTHLVSRAFHDKRIGIKIEIIQWRVLKFCFQKKFKN